MTPIPHNDFDDFNTHELRRLNAELTGAQHEQSAAQAISDSLSTRLTALQVTLAKAQASAAAATANLATAQSITQTVDKADPLARDAYRQATQIVAAMQPVFEKAYATSLLLVNALERIDALSAQVERRVGKNELTSPVIISGTAQLKADGLTALATTTTALQKTMLALAAAREADEAASRVIVSGQRLLHILAPGKPFDPQHLDRGGLWPEDTKRADSLVELAASVKQHDLAVLAVMDALQQIADHVAQEQQAAATQTTLELNNANDTLQRTIAKAQAARASLTAAEAVVS